SVSCESVLAALPDRGVYVHAGAVVSEHWLWHECGSLPMQIGCVLDRVLVLMNKVSGGDDVSELNADLALSSRYFVMVQIDRHTHLLHIRYDLASEIHLRVLRSSGEIAHLVTNLVTEIYTLCACGPGPFLSIDL